MVPFVQEPYVVQSQQMIFFSSLFCPLFPHVVILFPSSRSVSANNWVTLMGHDMCGARLLACCSSDGREDKTSRLLLLLFLTPCLVLNTCRIRCEPPPPVLRTCHPSPRIPPSTTPPPRLLFPRVGLLCKVIKRVRGGPGVLQSRRVTRSAGLFSSVSLRDACDARVYSWASPSVVNKHCGPFIHTVGVEIRTAKRSPSFQVFIPHCQHCSA